MAVSKQSRDNYFRKISIPNLPQLGGIEKCISRKAKNIQELLK